MRTRLIGPIDVTIEQVGQGNDSNDGEIEQHGISFYWQELSGVAGNVSGQVTEGSLGAARRQKSTQKSNVVRYRLKADRFGWPG